MGIIGAIFVAVWLFLYGLLTNPWATGEARALGWVAIISAVVIILELVFSNWHRLPRA